MLNKKLFWGGEWKRRVEEEKIIMVLEPNATSNQTDQFCKMKSDYLEILFLFFVI